MVKSSEQRLTGKLVKTASRFENKAGLQVCLCRETVAFCNAVYTCINARLIAQKRQKNTFWLMTVQRVV